METAHPLRALLQLQLASDEYAVTHLPYVLTSLTAECFTPSPHLHIWNTRIGSILNSKNPGARWAGICIAHKTSTLSKSIVIDCGQNWLGVALPILSKNDPVPTIKAAIRLISRIFSVAKSVPEFQRHVVTPVVPKFSMAVVELAQKHDDIELRVLCMSTLARVVKLYPAQHKALHPNLSALSFKFLEGSAPKPVDEALVQAASHLFSVLYLTAGKVGAVTLWRKHVDESIASTWETYLGLRSTFPDHGAHPNRLRMPSTVDDPLISVPLKLDRLRCCVNLLCHFMRSATHRAVHVPIGSLNELAGTLLSCTADGKREGHVDPAVHAMEVSVVPSILDLSCNLIDCVVKRVGNHFTPHSSKAISYIAFHLEQKPMPSLRLAFLRSLEIILSNSHPIHDTLLLNRLARAILPSLSAVLATRSETISENDVLRHRNKKDRKRLRSYEGAEVFNPSREVICSTVDEGKVILTTLHVIQLLLLNPDLSSNLFSLASRVLLSMLCALPRISPNSISPDSSLHGQVSKKVQAICTTIGLGTSSAMSRSLNLVMGTIVGGGDEHSSSGPHRDFEVLLHPRLPPLVRAVAEFENQSFDRMGELYEEPDGIEPMDTTTSGERDTPRAPPPEAILREKPNSQNPEQDPKPPTSLDMPASLSSKGRAESFPAVSAPAIPSDPSTVAYLQAPSLQTTATTSQVTVTNRLPPAPPHPNTAIASEDEDDEPMPAINVESDSD